jgi:hypothetical protein
MCFIATYISLHVSASKPSSGVSKHRILKVAVTDPLLKIDKANNTCLNIVVKEGFIVPIY